MADQCGFVFKLTDRYFKAPILRITTKSFSSALPNGAAWVAKVLESTQIYAIVASVAAIFNSIQVLYEALTVEFNLYTTLDYLGIWEKSVSLPDTRITTTVGTTCERRRSIKQRLQKKATVTALEMQELVDETFPGYGIWVVTDRVDPGYIYTFRYTFGGFTSGRWVLNIHIPWLAIDESDLAGSPFTWDNLQSWFRDFTPAPVLLNPVYEPQASYAVITYPQLDQSVYALSDGIGGWLPIDIHWKQIDQDGTVTNHIDSESILPTTTEISRSFTDSGAALISTTQSVRVITLLI